MKLPHTIDTTDLIESIGFNLNQVEGILATLETTLQTGDVPHPKTIFAATAAMGLVETSRNMMESLSNQLNEDDHLKGDILDG